MTAFIDRLQTAIRAVADASSDNIDIALWGTPSGTIVVPSTDVDDDVVARTVYRGQLWDSKTIGTLLNYFTDELDKFLVSWAHIYTSATSVDPIIESSYGVDTVSKNEGTGTLRVDWLQDYNDWHYFTAAHFNGLTTRTFLPAELHQGYCKYRIYDESDVLLNINTRYIGVVAVGLAS